MKRQADSTGQLRAAFTMHFLENAKRDAQTESGLNGIFVRVTLAIIFVYLIVISYQVMGVTGPLFISALFLISFFLPVLYRSLTTWRRERKAQKADRSLGHGSTHTG